MFIKIPMRYFAYIMFAVALAGLAVTIYKPPFWFSMTVYAVSITIFAVGLARAIAEARKAK